MATFYIDPNGIDTSGRNGSVGQEWATLGYACDRVTTPGNTIYINAGLLYTQATQCILRIGVNIEGAGESVVKIRGTYNAAGQPLILLETGTGGSWIDGNQSISHLTIDGNLTTYAGIYVVFRSNVKIDHCTVLNFVRRGVRFFGNPMYTWTEDNIYSDHPTEYLKMPSRWCTGNEFTNSIINNCSDYYNGNGNGCLLVGQQDGMIITYNTITQTGRASGLNGYGIKFDDNGFNKNCKIYDNTITVAKKGDVVYEFAIEWWWDLGGTEIYNNRIIGAIDLVHAIKGPGTTYAVKIYKNIIGYEALQAQQERGILLEGRCEYVYIYNNIIKNIANAIYVPRHNYSYHDYLRYIYIYQNLMINLGNTGDNYRTWGFYYPDYAAQDSSNDFYIWNNVIEASTNPLATTSRWGIEIPRVYELTTCHIKNNILLNWDNAGIRGNNLRTVCAGLVIQNNIYYNNGNSNDPLWADGFVEPGDIVKSGNLKEDPLFRSPTDYHLLSGSPAVASGIDVGLDCDFDGIPWADIPSRGVYESSYNPYGLPFTENFNASSLPVNWTTQNTGTGITQRWSVSNSTNAGGSVYEMHCLWQAINPGTTRLVTPAINTVGITYSLDLSFRSFIDDYGPGATLRIQSSTDSVNWINEAWYYSTVADTTVGPSIINTTIVYNLNSSTTYIAFVITGSLYQFDHWYIDNIYISSTEEPPAGSVVIINSANLAKYSVI